MIELLQKLCQTPLYFEKLKKIRPNYQDQVELANINKTIDMK